MTEEQTQQAQPQESQQQEQIEQEESKEEGKLTPEEFLTRLQQLLAEEKKTASNPEVEEVLSQIIQSQATEKGEEIPEEELEEITSNPKKLLEYVTAHVEQKLAYPLLVQIEQIKIAGEINALSQKHPDAQSIMPEVLKTAMAHPSLTLEQAYYIAKGNKPQTTQGTPKKEKEQVVPISSLKPNISRQTMKETPSDIKGAAAKAIAEILGEAV